MSKKTVNLKKEMGNFKKILTITKSLKFAQNINRNCIG